MRVKTSRTLVAVEPDDIALARHLTRVRHRVRLILLTKGGVAALSLSAAAVSIVVAWPNVIPAVAWVAFIAVACALAVAAAFLRTPDVRETAALIDRRLQLSDAVVMAVALRGNREAMARLIVRDTLSRVTDVRVVSVFPFELGRPVIMMAAAAVVCVVVVTGMSGRQRSRSNGAGGATPSNVASGGSQMRSAQAPSTAADEALVQPGSVAIPGTPAAPVPTPAGSVPTPREAEGARRGVADPQSARSGEVATGSNGDRSSIPRLDRAANQTGEQTGAAPRARSGRGGGASRGTAAESANGAGGIQQGPLQASVPVSAVPSDPNYRAVYRAARTRVDTAVARDEVPRARRAYVRDYFLAIAPRD